METQGQGRHHNRVYSSRVVMWLLVAQRLGGGAPLEAAVMELLAGLPASFWPRPCKRLRNWRQHGKAPSHHTGAYSQARQALALSVVQQSCDRIFESLVAEAGESDGKRPWRAFVLDGSSLRLAHSQELVRLYPPGSNQHGTAHWPVLRVLVAHDVSTGLAMRPEWGPMYGPEAVSEQGLLEAAIHRLPAGSVVMGDANFGVFSVARCASQTGHPVVLRLSTARAQRLLGGGELRDGIDREVDWKASAADRRSHPNLAAGASVKGRLLVRRVQPSNGAAAFLLALFTTLPATQQQIVELYGERWNIETDLRTLKATLKLDQLTSVTADLVAKEIEMGMAAYNLVRAMIRLAAQTSGVAPRSYSFTSVERILRTFTRAIDTASDPMVAQRLFDQMMHYIQQSKHPRRTRKRPSYPRKVWPRGAYFPSRNS